jgi:hypothetical protein
MTDHCGVTTAIRIPAGHYDNGAFRSTLATLTGLTVSLDRTTRQWTLTHPASLPFTLHFNPKAEGGAWATGGTPPPEGSILHAARVLGFMPNASIHAPKGTVTSTEASTIVSEASLGPYNANHPYASLAQTGTDRVGPFCSIQISTRDPPTRRIVLGCRAAPNLNVTLAYTSPLSSTTTITTPDGDMETTLVTVTRTGYTLAPPFPFAVGQVIRLAHTARGRVGTGMVLSIGTTMVVRMDSNAVLWAFGTSGGAGVAMAKDAPLVDLYASPLGPRMGLRGDLLGVESAASCPAMWDLDHASSILVNVEPVGAASTANRHDLALIQQDNQVTRCLARVPVKTQGVVYIQTLGTQDVILPSLSLRRLRITLRNPDGTPYESNGLEHTIGIIILPPPALKSSHRG